MTHFLSRLVKRARGTAPRVEPLVAPRFAPHAAEASPPEETATVVRPHHEVRNGREPAVPPENPHPAPPDAVAGEPTSRQQRPPSTKETRDSTSAAATNAGLRPESLLVPTWRDDDSRAQPPSASPDDKGRADVNLTSPRSSSPVTPRRSRVRAAPPSSPGPTTADSDPRFFPDAPPHSRAPVVRVTIGRIEVRGVAPSPAAATLPSRRIATQRTAGPTLTLDAYLQSRRKEGRRSPP